MVRSRPAEAAPDPLASDFAERVQPFLKANCVKCHNADTQMSGVRVDQLDATLDDRHVKVWEQARHRIEEGSMPPKGMPQPSAAERKMMVDWITRGLEVARSRPAPKNGSTRRLTVAQYRNTLRELLKLEDDFTEIIPPDAVSKDGFVNNRETLQLNPLLLETYLEIAEEALDRSIVDPAQKPKIQNFRMDFGAHINKSPLKEKLILGAGSALLENHEFTVTQLVPKKPFPFEPFFMRTKFRFIEGYQGNDTVRGWRDFDSIYHAVFADMRGSGGYPKGKAHSVVPEGLLLRPAIPNDELFQADGTYGPKANFKISLRELPDYGRFRVTVDAAKYNDGLMLDKDAPAAAESPSALVSRTPKTPQTLTVAKAGVYQVDLYRAKPRVEQPPVDASQLSKGRSGVWTFDETDASVKTQGNAKYAESPFGKALSLDGMGDFATVARGPATNFNISSFTISLWIHPTQIRKAGILAAGAFDYTHGWYLDMPDNRGSLRFETSGPDGQPNGTITSPPGVLRNNAWQHIAIVVPRLDQAKLYVNGYQVGEGKISPAPLDNPKIDLHFGRIPKQPQFRGMIDEVRFYTRVLAEPELQALIQPGRQFALPPPERIQDVTLTLGDRQFAGTLQTGFLHVRLPAGPLTVSAKPAGLAELDRVVITPVTDAAALARFATFEKRLPKLGVHLGLRRDCGSTFAPVGGPQAVTSGKYVFEGAIRNHPSPDVEKDNVNYLAGVREIAVRSEYSDGRDMPRMLIRSIEFEGPLFEQWPPPTHANIFVSSDARTVIRQFATRAYRRPLTPGEEQSLYGVYEKSAKAGRGFREAVKDALTVVLTSPQFLFLIEKSATPGPEPLTSHELASKLSYFLWNGPPDAALRQQADAGTLRTQLAAQVNRLVADGRFEQFTKEFASQWLALDKFQVVEVDKGKYPKLTRDAKAHLKQEPIAFVQHLIRQNLPVKNLIASDFVMANEAVASYYELGAKTERGFDFVAIPHGRPELGGVLTQAAIMSGLSDGRESNPVKRGAWLARRIVAEPPDDPPPNVPALKEAEAGLTLRQRIEQHRNQAGCRQCHAKIDPWGVAFEQFDAGGRLKAEPADASSVLPDKAQVNNIQDLKRHLAEDRVDQVAFSVLKHLMTYATGRTLTYQEQVFLKQDQLKLKPGGYRMKDMIHYVVASKPFLEK